MFATFLKRFGETLDADLDLGGAEALRHQAGDCVFGAGAYRVLSDKRAEMLARSLFQAYPAFDRSVDLFGISCMGDIFALRRDTQMVLMFEPGTSEALNTGASLPDFHNAEIVDNPDAALAEHLFAKWRALGHPVPELSQCVGYVKPLFQGGADEITNLELIDLDVYWTVTAPFIAKARKTFALRAGN